MVWFEVSRFTPQGTHQAWWLSGKVPCLEKFIDPRLDERDVPPIYLHLKVRGTLSPEGHYGHLGSYSHSLELAEVLSCRLADAAEAK